MGTEVAKLFDWEQQQQRHDWKFGRKKKKLSQICQLCKHCQQYVLFWNEQRILTEWVIGACEQNFYPMTANGYIGTKLYIGLSFAFDLKAAFIGNIVEVEWWFFPLHFK